MKEEDVYSLKYDCVNLLFYQYWLFEPSQKEIIMPSLSLSLIEKLQSTFYLWSGEKAGIKEREAGLLDYLLLLYFFNVYLKKAIARQAKSQVFVRLLKGIALFILVLRWMITPVKWLIAGILSLPTFPLVATSAITRGLKRKLERYLVRKDGELHLMLRNLPVYDMPSNEFACLLQAIPRSVTHLNLNGLICRTNNEFLLYLALTKKSGIYLYRLPNEF